MVKIISVAAVAANRVIGDSSHNEVPWRINEYALKYNTFWNTFKDKNSFRPNDMAYFKKKTAGGAVAMGRKTWDSIPDRFKPLDERPNLVLSTTLEPREDITIYRSLDEFFAGIEQYDKVSLIGGGFIYKLGMEIADELHITRLHQDFDGDVYFPLINDLEWDLEQKIVHESNQFQFETYTRR